MCSTVPRKPLLRVLLSSSRCIYENLAVEEGLMRSHDPERDGDLLMVWSNRPAVVVGRHQNPWVEANVPLLHERGVDLARRHSGGGTVYHDEGNVNISLLTSQKDHCRKRNLVAIADALNRRFRLQVVPTARDDLEMEPGQRKCSGTAARIARSRAYHHLTMLIRVHLATLSETLRSPFKAMITSTATQSVRAPAVGYLQQDDEEASVEEVKQVLIHAFDKQYLKCSEGDAEVDRRLREDEHARKALVELRSADWIYGRTPRFELKTKNGVVVVEKGRIVGGDGSLVDLNALRKLIV